MMKTRGGMTKARRGDYNDKGGDNKNKGEGWQR